VGVYNQQEEDVMARIIQCECGFVARGNTDDEVIEVIRGHMRTDHPALLDTVGQDDLLGWIKVE
jgi:predicted small metal-binding protein